MALLNSLPSAVPPECVRGVRRAGVVLSSRVRKVSPLEAIAAGHNPRFVEKGTLGQFICALYVEGVYGFYKYDPEIIILTRLAAKYSSAALWSRPVSRWRAWGTLLNVRLSGWDKYVLDV